MTGNSDDEINFPRKLLLTNGQVINLCKAFANYLSTDIKLSETLLSKMIQSGGFLGRRLGRFGHSTALIISNDEIKDILEIVKSLEDFGLLLKRVSDTIKNEAK